MFGNRVTKLRVPYTSDQKFGLNPLGFGNLLPTLLARALQGLKSSQRTTETKAVVTLLSGRL